MNLRKDHSHTFQQHSCEFFCEGLCEDVLSAALMQMLEGGGADRTVFLFVPTATAYCMAI